MSVADSVGPSSPRTARTYFWDVARPLYAELLSQPDLARSSGDVGPEARNYSAEEAKDVIQEQELQIQSLSQRVAVLEGHLNAYEMNPKDEGIRKLLEEQTRSQCAQECEILKKE